ncbi:MAG: hypothetical protein MHM6MM_006990 [Cercozoa sp. M6MM]
MSARRAKSVSVFGSTSRSSARDLEKHPGVSREELDDLRQAFELFDVRETGTIARQDVHAALSSLGYDRRSPFAGLMVSKLASAPETLDFDAFVDAMSVRVSPEAPPENLERVFELFDVDGDGMVRFDDLKRVCVELGEEIPDDEIRDMVDRADLEDKGGIARAEFVAILRKHLPRGRSSHEATES